MSTVSPFAEGQLAFTAGKPIYANPYTWHNDAWYKWNKGWTLAADKAYNAARKAADKAQREAIDARELPQWAELEAGK